MYKLMPNGVQRIAGGACIPNDTANRDWQEYQQWVAAGNAPLQEPPPTLGELQFAKICRLYDNTKRHITSELPAELRMPEWRQNNAQAYIRLYEKKQGGATLDAQELAIYNRIIDLGETEAQCYAVSKARLAWIGDCMAVHDALKQQILAAADEADLSAIDVDAVAFPAWIG